MNPKKVCGNCEHYMACAAWNIGSIASMDGSHCVNYKKAALYSDSVQVVRCADCIYWEPENAEEGDYSGHCKRSFGICYGQITDASWFCADGEREE